MAAPVSPTQVISMNFWACRTLTCPNPAGSHPGNDVLLAAKRCLAMQLLHDFLPLFRFLAALLGPLSHH